MGTVLPVVLIRYLYSLFRAGSSRLGVEVGVASKVGACRERRARAKIRVAGGRPTGRTHRQDGGLLTDRGRMQDIARGGSVRGWPAGWKRRIRVASRATWDRDLQQVNELEWSRRARRKPQGHIQA